MCVEAEFADRLGNLLRRNTDGTSHRTRGRNIGHQVRSHHADFGQVVERCDRHRSARTLLNESAITEDVLHVTNLADAWGHDAESDGSSTVDDIRLLDHSHGLLVARVIDTGNASVGENLGLACAVSLETAVPIEVILSDVENRCAVRLDDPGQIVQLKTAQLDDQGIPALRVANRIQDWHPDVAAGDGAATRLNQHRLGQLNGCGLAVGSGDQHPIGNLVGLVTQAPGQIDINPDRNRSVRGPGQEFVFRTNPG